MAGAAILGVQAALPWEGQSRSAGPGLFRLVKIAHKAKPSALGTVRHGYFIPHSGVSWSQRPTKWNARASDAATPLCESEQLAGAGAALDTAHQRLDRIEPAHRRRTGTRHSPSHHLIAWSCGICQFEKSASAAPGLAPWQAGVKIPWHFGQFRFMFPSRVPPAAQDSRRTQLPHP